MSERAIMRGAYHEISTFRFGFSWCYDTLSGETAARSCVGTPFTPSTPSPGEPFQQPPPLRPLQHPRLPARHPPRSRRASHLGTATPRSRGLQRLLGGLLREHASVPGSSAVEPGLAKGQLEVLGRLLRPGHIHLYCHIHVGHEYYRVGEYRRRMVGTGGAGSSPAHPTHPWGRFCSTWRCVLQVLSHYADVRIMPTPGRRALSVAVPVLMRSA